MVANGGILAPGNSIGTLTVSGNFARSAASTRSRPMPRARATASMSAARPPSSGAAVQVLAQPGNYGRSTTYTILRANGGVAAPTRA